MPRALQPRPGKSGRRPPRREVTLPRDVLEEVRRAARPGQGDEALRHLERAVELLARGDTRQGGNEAERAKTMAPRSGAVREVLGLAYYGAERWREALRELQAYRRMTGRADQNHLIAEEALRARIPEESKAEAVIVAASALADLGRFDEGLALLHRLPARSDVGRPHDLRVWYVTGSILARAGRREDAAREFRRILRHDQTAFDAAERLAELA